MGRYAKKKSYRRRLAAVQRRRALRIAWSYRTVIEPAINDHGDDTDRSFGPREEACVLQET